MSVIEGINMAQSDATTGGDLGSGVYRAYAQISNALGDDFSADTATTGRVMVGGGISGAIETNGDSDWIAINLVAGSRYTLNLKGASSGSGTLADPVIDSIRDASGNTMLGGYADDGGTGYDSLLSFTPSTSGTFYVVARSVNNTGTGTYLLTASTPTGSADDFSADVATTGRVAVGGSRSGVLEASGDTDWIGVNLTAGGRYTFNLKGASSGVGTLNDPVIDSVRDASGNALPNSSADDGGMGLDSLLSFTPTTSGMFYVVARSYGSDTGSYVLSAETATTPPISTTAATLSIAASSAYKAEGHSGSTPFTFTVTRAGTTTGVASAAWAVTGSGPNPANGTDFVGGALPSGTVTFSAGQTTATVTVNVSGDLTAEADDGFTIALSNPVGATLGTSTVATTLNQSASGGVGVTQNDYILAGAGGAFTVNYNNYSIPDQVDVSVNGQKITGTAGQVSNTGTLTIPASTTLRAGDVVSVIMTGTDSGTAWDYTANYTGGAQLANYIASGTIINDDGAVPVSSTLAIAATSAYKSEGNSGSTPFTFTVTRAGTTTGVASAAWAVTGSGPNPANGTDFVGGTLPSGTVTFSAGQTTATVTVNVSGDLTAEADDGFTIALSNPVGATLGTSTVATTLNQSASGGVGVTQNDYILAGAGGAFTVNYNNYSIPDQVDVSVNGQKITGTAGQVSNTGTLTIPASTTLRAGDVVSVIMTGTDSGTAWDYTANYTGGAQLANYVVAGTILNDDQGSVTPPSSGKIIGTSANDTLQGTAGNDVVDGLGGVDTFVCSGNRASYTVNRSFGGYTITGPEGVDTLANVERIRFADSKLGLDVSGNLGSVVKLLGAVFGAASVGRADFVGIGLNYMDNGMSYASLGALALSAAGKSTPTDIVNLLWFNVVGTPASAAQAQPYVAMLNNGMSSGDLVVLAADTAINQANIGLVGLEQTGVAYI